MKANAVNREQAAQTSSTGTASRLAEFSALVLVMLYAYAGPGPGRFDSHMSSEELVLITAETRFHPGSISETFASATAVRMVEPGWRGFDDEAIQHLEEPGIPGQSMVRRLSLDHASRLPGPCKRCC